MIRLVRLADAAAQIIVDRAAQITVSIWLSCCRLAKSGSELNCQGTGRLTRCL